MSSSEDESAKNKSIKKEESSVQTQTENFDIEMPRDDELKIHAFDGSDYKIWKKRILMYLKWKECEEPATKARTTENEADWNKKDVKAINYIYNSISNDQMEFIDDETTVYGIKKKFDQLYWKVSNVLQICMRNKLDGMRLKDYEDAAKFFTDFEKTINELKSAGGRLNEQEKLNYMLRSLPDSLNYIGDMIDTMSEENRDLFLFYLFNCINGLDCPLLQNLQ